MSDLQATLDAIDQLAVHECGHCRMPLPADSESLDFCGPHCQTAWLSAKQEIIELVGYREPDDLPQHVDNLTELRSPETTPAVPDWLPEGRWWEVELRTGFRFEFDPAPIIATFTRPDGYAGTITAAMTRMTAGWVIFDEANANWSITVPEPQVQFRVAEPDEPPFGSDFNFEWTPAKTLPHAPLPAVMPSRPDRDWQAIVDAATAHTGPQRRVRAPRHLGRPQ